MTRTAVLLVSALLAGCASNRLEAPKCSGDATSPANVLGASPVVWDDRTDTWMRWPGQQRRPTISVLREDGTEATVNTYPSPDTDTVKIRGIHPTIVLREGARVACVINNAYDRVGVRAGS